MSILGALTSAYGIAKAIGKGVAQFGQGVAPWAQIYGQYQANQQNMSSARQQMSYQTMMSNTAHQREVEDLRKAGLNPILSANKGASTPQGAGYQVENIASSLPDALAKISEVELTKANSALTAEKTNTERINQRILEKEYGIKDIDLKYHDKFKNTDLKIKEFAKALGEIEVSSAKKKNAILDLQAKLMKPGVTLAEVKQALYENPMLRDVIAIFEAFITDPLKGSPIKKLLPFPGQKGSQLIELKGD